MTPLGKVFMNFEDRLTVPGLNRIASPCALPDLLELSSKPLVRQQQLVDKICNWLPELLDPFSLAPVLEDAEERPPGRINAWNTINFPSNQPHSTRLTDFSK
jgi:hypothetical protein